MGRRIRALGRESPLFCRAGTGDGNRTSNRSVSESGVLRAITRKRCVFRPTSNEAFFYPPPGASRRLIAWRSPTRRLRPLTPP
jgi:hypothetical protein